MLKWQEMNSWSAKRKRIILPIILLALVVLVGLPIFLGLYESPSCFDGEMNGKETGIDCGGDCRLLCTAESLPLILNGDPRVLEIGDETFVIVVSVNNTNAGAEIPRAGYIVKVYDASGVVPLKVIDGETFVPNSGTFIIFEGPLAFEKGVLPTRATFEWQEETLIWQRSQEESPELAVTETTLSRENTSPRLEAMVTNLSLEDVSNISLTAVISNEAGNIFAAAETFVEYLPSGAVAPVTFIWPRPFRKTGEDICDYPVDVTLVIDRSGSMDDLGGDPPQPLADVKNTALYFIDQFGRKNKHSLISFANEASRPADSNLSFNVEDTKLAIENISILTEGEQNTNIGDGILAARQELSSERQRDEADKAIVLLTDGVATLPQREGFANYPKAYAIEEADMARKENVSIYTIGLGKEVDIDLLRRLATTTKEAYLAPTTQELNGIYEQIVTKICKTGLAKINIYTKILPDRSFLK